MSRQEQAKGLDMSCTQPKRKRNSTLPTTAKTEAMWSKSAQPSRRLTQQELNAWWPFDRLDPRLMPKLTKLETTSTLEEAPI